MSDGKGVWRINRPANNDDAPEAAGSRPKIKTPIVWWDSAREPREGSGVRLYNVLTPGAMIAIQWGAVAGIAVAGCWLIQFLR